MVVPSAAYLHHRRHLDEHEDAVLDLPWANLSLVRGR
jgi:hypothetical protein